MVMPVIVKTDESNPLNEHSLCLCCFFFLNELCYAKYTTVCFEDTSTTSSWGKIN